MSSPFNNRETSGDTLRVAVAGKEGGRVDKHFGAVEIFLIYDLSAVDHKLVERRAIDQLALPDEERRATIVRILRGLPRPAGRESWRDPQKPSRGRWR